MALAAIFDARGQFLHIHQNDAVAVDIDHPPVRACEFWLAAPLDSQLHCAQTGAGQELARFGELAIGLTHICCWPTPVMTASGPASTSGGLTPFAAGLPLAALEMVAAFEQMPTSVRP